jgi:hypothetical protein
MHKFLADKRTETGKLMRKKTPQYAFDIGGKNSSTHAETVDEAVNEPLYFLVKENP